MRYTIPFARSLVAFALAAAGCASSSAESKKLPSLEDSRTITDGVTEALVTYVDAPKK